MNIFVDKKKTEERRQQLKAMYDRYYTCEGHVCRYFKECSPCAEEGYNSSHAVKLGTNYDLFIDGNPIRILFMGKESPADNRKDRVEETAKLSDCLLKNGAVNPHYLKTYSLLCDMLNYRPSAVRPYRSREDAVLSFFSLTNRFRCAMKDVGQRSGVKNSSEQRAHCLEILREEIRIMEPTVLILQHKATKAIDIFDDALECHTFGEERIVHSPKYNCHVIETVHPCVRDGSWTQHSSALHDAVIWLKEKGVLPPFSCDVTEVLNRIVNEKEP